MGGQPSPAVQAVARALGERLREGPRTLNELRDWWVKECSGDAGALQDAAKYLISVGLVEPRNVGKVKLLALAGEHHQPRPKGSAIVRDPSVRDPERGPSGETVTERAARLDRAAEKPFSAERLRGAILGREQGASTAAVAPPPQPPPAPPRPSTSAPSPAAAQAASLNNRAVERSHDKPALSPPPAPVSPRGNATPSASAGATPAAATQSGPARYRVAPPPADADGTVWLSGDRVAEMLGISRASMAELARRASLALRKRKGPGLEHEQRAPWFYAEASVHALMKVRATSSYVHANRGKEIAAAVAGDVEKSNAKRKAIDEALAERPELVEHQRQVAAAGLPRIILPQGDAAASRRKEREAAAADAGYLFVWLPPAPRALLESLLATGMYGDGSAHELAERLLLAELRRHVDMPRLIERARR